MERTRITDENVDDLLEKFGDEWWTGRDILASFAKIQRHYLVDWSKDGRLRRMPIEPRPQRGARFLYSVGDAITARHNMREAKPFLNRIGSDGIREFRCNICEEWKKVDGFYPNTSQGRGPGMHTHCKTCHAEINRRHRKDNFVEMMKGRERSKRRRKQSMARAEAATRWERTSDVDAQRVVDFIDTHYPDTPGTVLADRCGSHVDLIVKLRKQARAGRRIKFATADTILSNLGGENLLSEIISELEAMRPEWHPGHPYCKLCMRTSVAHEAKGYCYTCYNKRDEPDFTPIMDGQWARRHVCCSGCGTTDRRHYGHGLCRLCWDRRRRRAAKVVSGHGNLRSIKP